MSQFKKIKKSAKAALPLFALLGGPGFASSRNPLTLQSSKKVAGKSVVIIHDSDSLELPDLTSRQNSTTKSPFSAFTNKKITTPKNVNISAQPSTLKFLKKNNLLNYTEKKNVNLSGNTINKSRKAFSHTFMLSVSNYGTEQCDNVPQYKSFRYTRFLTSSTTSSCIAYYTTTGGNMSCTQYSYFPTNTRTSTYCSLYDNTNANPFSTATVVTATTVNQPSCQKMHQKCYGHANLPVELKEFKID